MATTRQEGNGCVMALFALGAIVAALTATTRDHPDGYFFAGALVIVGVILHYVLKGIAKRNAEEAARLDMAARAQEYAQRQTPAPRPPEPK